MKNIFAFEWKIVVGMVFWRSIFGVGGWLEFWRVGMGWDEGYDILISYG